MECLEAVAWEGGDAQASSFALVQEPEQEENNSDNDDYVNVVAPSMTASISVIRVCWSGGCR